jgi:hypothetical protein
MPLDEEVSCRLMENGKMLLDIAHLIDRKCVERYQNKFMPPPAPSCASARCSFRVRGRRIISSTSSLVPHAPVRNRQRRLSRHGG